MKGLELGITSWERIESESEPETKSRTLRMNNKSEPKTTKPPINYPSYDLRHYDGLPDHLITTDLPPTDYPTYDLTETQPLFQQSGRAGLFHQQSGRAGLYQQDSDAESACPNKLVSESSDDGKSKRIGSLAAESEESSDSEPKDRAFYWQGIHDRVSILKLLTNLNLVN